MELVWMNACLHPHPGEERRGSATPAPGRRPGVSRTPRQPSPIGSCRPEAMRRLHPDQFDVTTTDVARLLRAQFPQLAGLAITEVPSSGTMNAVFRVGERYCARLPFIPWGSA